jgi:hypothetical protein
LAIKSFLLLVSSWELNATAIISFLRFKIPLGPLSSCLPIFCCNTLNKIISKILANRLKGCLNGLISSCQTAFIPGRKIVDNILFASELMRTYHRNIKPARCNVKVDIFKSYDFLDWESILGVLIAVGCPPKFMTWIKTCITSPQYRTVMGLRQGDPISPYLFGTAMEAFSKLMQRAIENYSSFVFNSKCAKIKLSPLCFADDLMIFVAR